MAETKETVRYPYMLLVEFGILVDDAAKREELAHRRCRIKDKQNSTIPWKGGLKGGYCNGEPTENDEYNVRYACNYLETYNGCGYWLDILRDTPPEPLPDGRLSKLEWHFKEDFIDLMKMTPNNEQVRGIIMQRLKRQPSKSLDTFDKLKDWIERTFGPSGAVPSKPAETLEPHIETVQPPQAAPATINFEFVVTDTEYGTCTYNNDRRGTMTKAYNTEDIEEWIREGEDVGSILDRIHEYAEENNTADMQDVPGTITYDGHDANDHDNQDIAFTDNEADRKRRLIEFIKQYLPERAEELGL